VLLFPLAIAVDESRRETKRVVNCILTVVWDFGVELQGCIMYQKIFYVFFNVFFGRGVEERNKAVLPKMIE
jgi:hypothetical protein